MATQTLYTARVWGGKSTALKHFKNKGIKNAVVVALRTKNNKGYPYTEVDYIKKRKPTKIRGPFGMIPRSRIRF